MATTADQDYTKAIYTLTADGLEVTTSSLATVLNVRPASVSGMLKKLSRDGLVSHKQRGKIALSAKGRRLALRTIRRHRLIELFLVEVVGMPWDMVHEEAERLEHAVSKVFEERIDELLGHPTADPHGAPIPTADGVIPSGDRVRLDQMPAGARGTVREVRDGDPEMLRYLEDIGLVPGRRIRLKEILAFDGTIVVEVNRQARNLSGRVASSVWVEPDPDRTGS
jgi:DtxR family Mn-dependent transcriptional regulator